MIVTNFPIDIDVTNTVYECGLPVTVEEREVQYQEFPSWWRNRFNSLQHALHFKIGP